MRKLPIYFFIALWLFGGGVSIGYGEENKKIHLGFSILGATDADFIHERPTLTLLGILPRVDFPLLRRWSFELEGNLSYYWVKDEKNLYLLGTHSNILFKPFERKGWRPFFIWGVGVGYMNSNKNLKYIGDSHRAGIIHGGGGVEILIKGGTALRWEYRLYHISDPFNHDQGINTHNFLIGLSF